MFLIRDIYLSVIYKKLVWLLWSDENLFSTKLSNSSNSINNFSKPISVNNSLKALELLLN